MRCFYFPFQIWRACKSLISLHSCFRPSYCLSCALWNSFCSAGYWLWSLALAGRALHHWATSARDLCCLIFCLFHCVAPAAWNSEIYLPHLPECWDSKYMLLSLASRVVIPSATLTICSHLPRSDKSNISGQDEKRGVSVVSPMRQRKWVTHSSIMECLKGGFSFCLKEILAGMLAKYFPTQGALVNCSIHVQLQWSFIAYFPWARG